jgi:hypothetical protein
MWASDDIDVHGPNIKSDIGIPSASDDTRINFAHARSARLGVWYHQPWTPRHFTV